MEALCIFTMLCSLFRLPSTACAKFPPSDLVVTSLTGSHSHPLWQCQDLLHWVWTLFSTSFLSRQWRFLWFAQKVSCRPTTTKFWALQHNWYVQLLLFFPDIFYYFVRLCLWFHSWHTFMVTYIEHEIHSTLVSMSLLVLAFFVCLLVFLYFFKGEQKFANSETQSGRVISDGYNFPKLGLQNLSSSGWQVLDFRIHEFQIISLPINHSNWKS